MGIRLRRSAQPLTDAWQHLPVEPRGSTRLGISFRPRQAEALGLDPAATLDALLSHPFEVLRLGAYWDRIDPRPGAFETDELDRQIDAAERAGKRVILAVGALKTFGYPELFVPPHRLARPLPEGKLVQPGPLLEAATEQIARVIERYRNRACIEAWQVEHEAVDPLGFEHSWRLSAEFVEAEVAAARRADPSRPILLNGYLPAAALAALTQWWRTRDQGDSTALAERLADVVGLDWYPCHALLALGPFTLYLEGNRQRVPPGERVMVTEGQAEPWEAVTTPPNPSNAAPCSCPPERVIANYNGWMGRGLDAYLFWGAEYWVLRERTGDPRYLRAFARILAEA